MLTKNINFKNFKIKKNNKKITKDFESLLKENNPILESLSLNYKNSYKKKIITKFKKYSQLRIIGMGGSILGTEAMHSFLKHKIKKKIIFIDNLQTKIKLPESKKNYFNLIVSKSGNTLETISNSNIIIKNKDENIFITENKKSY